MRNAAQYPHRVAAVVAMVAIFATIPLTGILVVKTINNRNSQAKAAQSDVPLLDRQDAVVIAERKVCSLLGANQTAVKIVGEDGGASARLGSNSFFTFGDTNLNTGAQLPNSSASTTDNDASDCITMNSKSSAGTAVPTLPKVSGECTVWPTDIVSAPDNKLHYFFSSLGAGCQIQHVGIAEMNPNNMDSSRVVPVFFKTQDSQIPNYKILGAAMTRSGNDIYVFFGGQNISNSKEVLLLAKVAASSVANKSAYTYWNGSTFQPNPASMVSIWDQGDIGTNGMTIRFNAYLNKWTAIYNTGYVSVMSMRTADSVTGPWSSEQILINCLQHFPLGSTGNSYPCYGAREYPHFQKNNGQTIYVVQSNTGEYKPFLHEIIFGKEIHQLTDANGNSLLRQKGDIPSGFSDNGVAFYASDVPFAGSVGIKEWVKGSEIVYSQNSPGAGFVDSGIKFYASSSKQFLMAPLYQWNKGAIHRYSALDLSLYGYVKSANQPFYARITNYRITDDKTNPRVSSNFQVGVWKNGNWVQGGKVKMAKFGGLTPNSKFSPILSTPLLPNTYLGQNIAADSGGNLSVSGNSSFVSVANLALFSENQQLNTTTNLYGFELKEGGALATATGHQVNPYRRSNNYKNFFITSEPARADYDARVCNTDCAAGSTVWTGKVYNCGEDITVTPTGGTNCAKLSELTLGGFAPSTQYDLYYCNPSCEDAVVKIIYSKISNAQGEIIMGGQTVQPTPSPVASPLPLGKFKAQYFNNVDFADKVLEREEDVAKITLKPSNTVPVVELNNDGNFAVRWEGRFNLTAGKYRFNTSASVNHSKVYVDDVLKVEGAAVQNALVDISSGEHKIKIEFIRTIPDRSYALTSNFFDRKICYDLNGDSVINSGDQGVLAAHFLLYAESPWDINGDNVTNSADQGLLASKFFEKCPFSVASPVPTPSPSSTPSPIAQACAINSGTVVKGSSINLTITGFIASNLPVSIIGAFGTPIYSLGTFSGTSATLTIPASAQNGLYRVRIGFSDGSFLYCSPDLAIN